MHTYLPAYLHYLHTCILPVSSQVSRLHIIPRETSCINLPALNTHRHTCICMQASSQRVKKNFWFWFWFRCVLYICSVGTGYPNARLMGTCMYVLVDKIGGTGNMGSMVTMVDIWGNEKKRERQEVKKEQVSTLRENFSWVGKRGRGRGRAAVEACELFSGSGSNERMIERQRES